MLTSPTFTDMASDQRNLETVKRTTRNACTAYNMIADRRKSILMSDKDAATLNSKLSRLKAALIKLGERFGDEHFPGDE